MKSNKEKLRQYIDKYFRSFLTRGEFRQAPTNLSNFATDRVAFYDGADYRLVFEIDPSDDITVVVRSLHNRLRGEL